MVFVPNPSKLPTVYLVILLIGITVANPISKGFPTEDEAMDGSRGLGYRKQQSGPVTVKPTWRPVPIPQIQLNPAVEIPDENSAEPDELFPQDYYDAYDGEHEGTKRNIAAFHTFEDRMKVYVKAIQTPKHTTSAPLSILDILSRSRSVAEVHAEAKPKKNSKDRSTVGSSAAVLPGGLGGSLGSLIGR